MNWQTVLDRLCSRWQQRMVEPVSFTSWFDPAHRGVPSNIHHANVMAEHLRDQASRQTELIEATVAFAAQIRANTIELAREMEQSLRARRAG